MSLATPFVNSRSTDNSLILGTAMFEGLGLGQVKSAEIDKKIDITKIKNDEGGIRAVLLQNPECSMSLDIILEIEQEIPAVGSFLALPDVAVFGIIESVSLSKKEGEIATYKITCKGWDELGAFTMYKLVAGDWVLDYATD